MATLRESRILEPALEQESAEARYARLSARLREIVALAYERAPRVREQMRAAGVGPADIRDLDDLPRLPITRKDDLSALQQADLPFARLLAVPVAQVHRILMSPGPIYDPQGPAEDFWRFRMAFAAAGLRAGDLVQNTLSYHLSPGGFMLEGGLRALGCVVIPAGTGQTGEVVATVFDTAYPLLRFATGDVSAFAADERCACSRTARKLSGLLGRVGDAVKVKGMFVRGAQLDAVFKSRPEVARWQAVVTRDGHHDQLAYLVELAAPASDPSGIAAQLAEALRETAKVRGEGPIVPAGTHPQPAKRSDDRRGRKRPGSN